jgi:23S rRNA pseudouridine1911/1915/1917 synthase
VHFRHLRYPLVGDATYRLGERHGVAFPRQALHAAELTLVHPTTRQVVSWKSPLPRDIKRLLQTLRDDRA